MTVSLKSIGALSLFVEDPQVSKAFYRQVFDVSVVFEDEYSVVVEFDNTIVNLLKSSAAHELIEPAMVAEPDIGHRFQLTGPRRHAAQRSDGPGVGPAHGQLRGSRRDDLGDRPADRRPRAHLTREGHTGEMRTTHLMGEKTR